MLLVEKITSQPVQLIGGERHAWVQKSIVLTSGEKENTAMAGGVCEGSVQLKISCGRVGRLGEQQGLWRKEFGIGRSLLIAAGSGLEGLRSWDKVLEIENGKVPIALHEHEGAFGRPPHRDVMAYTKLQQAACLGDGAVVRELLSQRAAVHERGCAGSWTALHIAAGNGHLGVVEALLAAKAETCVLDSDGRTAIDWAERRQQHLVAETLHRHERLHRLVNDSTAAVHAELNSKLFNAEAHAAQLARDLAAKLPGRPVPTSNSQAESSELAGAEKRLNSVEEHLQELEERLLKSEMRHQETESCLQELQDQSKGLLALEAKQQLSEESMLRLNSVEEQLADKNAELVALEAMAQNEREQRDGADKVEERCEELEIRCKSLQELEEREQLNPRRDVDVHSIPPQT
eukprot:s172_g42.t2